MSANADNAADSRLSRALAAFDAANAQDPRKIDGAGAELLYAQRMSRWLARLYPAASEALQLAARSQHLRRWMIPRSNYPMDRGGYLQWRTALYGFHADAAAKILQSVGYDPAIIARVGSLLKKEKLKTDPESQALEDVACLVFLENYLADFAPKHEEIKLVRILKRTWAKMSPAARQAASGLPMPDAIATLIKKAIG